MDVGTKIKGLLKEAELYRGQGLLSEAKGKLTQAADIIQSISNLKNKENLLGGINTKIKAVDMEIARVESADTTPVIEAETQKLIKRLFTFSQKEDADALTLEGAITLTRFGQYDKAIEEFTELLQKESIRLAAAKKHHPLPHCHQCHR
jgi:tetratricopeptide (TPR) repeat protein